LISVVICTYKRAEDVRRVLRSLAEQTYGDFEVLVVDGTGDDPVVREAVAEEARGAAAALELRVIESPKGLTRQRNAGLREAKGEVICYLDDDVTLDARFLERAAALLDDPSMHDVGGITGFDLENYPQHIGWRWRLRRALGTVPSLEPGAVDRLGRHVPLSFVQPGVKCMSVGWLPGFCMIYRREAIGDLRFDEGLPTYGGEDRDFSLSVGERARLVLCGDLRVRHHGSPGARSTSVRRVYETGYGTGRAFAKRVRGASDALRVAHYIVCEFTVDVIAFCGRPSGSGIRVPFARASGVIAGFNSVQRGARGATQS